MVEPAYSPERALALLDAVERTLAATPQAPPARPTTRREVAERRAAEVARIHAAFSTAPCCPAAHRAAHVLRRAFTLWRGGNLNALLTPDARRVPVQTVEDWPGWIAGQVEPMLCRALVDLAGLRADPWATAWVLRRYRFELREWQRVLAGLAVP